MIFGKFLSSKRIEKKITVRGFASMIGISPSFLCDLESGNRAFPAKSKKFPDLMNNIISSLDLTSEDSIMLRRLAEESMLNGDRLSPEISVYLQNVPEAQQALRIAKENGISKEEWNAFIKLIRKDK